jgi:Tfp pilus assembly protein PilF
MSCRLIVSVALFAWSALLFAQSSGNMQQQIESHSRQAQQYLQEKRPDLAVGELKAILAIDPGNVDARSNLGVLEYFQGQYAKAALDLRLAVNANPHLLKLKALLGMSEKRLGETAKSQADLENAFPGLAEQKLKISAGLELIEVDYALGDLGKAAEVVNVLRRLEPTNVAILYTAHRIYSSLSDETMLSLAMVAPDSARMQQIMAHELARQGKDDAAMADYRAALKIDPSLADVHYELAEMLYAQSSAGAAGEAEKEYKAALAGNPFDEKSECRLGDIALRRPDMKTAAVYYGRALEMQPNDPDANLGMAKVLMAIHQPRSAERYLERAVHLEPFNPAARYHLMVLYRELGRPDDSRRELAEFEKLKAMKSRLGDLYKEMRLQPGMRDQSDQDVPN